MVGDVGGARKTEPKSKEDSSENGLETRPWSELGQDILASIMDRLYLLERVRLGAVCRGWHLQHNDGVQPNMDKLPWTMEYDWSLPSPKSLIPCRSICKLYEPQPHKREQPYNVETEGREGWKHFFNARICACRDSWVLFSKAEKSRSQGNYFLFFFFNPFTNTLILIDPVLKSSSSSPPSELVTFSSAPTSPDCFVFVPCVGRRNKISISTYSQADKSWTSHPVVGYHQMGSAMAVCYMKGTFYCLFSRNHLVAFNVDAQQLSVVKTTRPPMRSLDPDSNSQKYYLLESDGNLVLVHLLIPYTIPHRLTTMHKLYAFRMDWEAEEWVIITSMGGAAMFLGETSFCLSAGGETDTIANRIYYYHDHMVMYQKLDLDSKYLWRSDGEESAEEHVYRCCDDDVKTIWIQPPPCHSTLL